MTFGLGLEEWRIGTYDKGTVGAKASDTGYKSLGPELGHKR